MHSSTVFQDYLCTTVVLYSTIVLFPLVLYEAVIICHGQQCATVQLCTLQHIENTIIVVVGMGLLLLLITVLHTTTFPYCPTAQNVFFCCAVICTTIVLYRTVMFMIQLYCRLVIVIYRQYSKLCFRHFLTFLH